MERLKLSTTTKLGCDFEKRELQEGEDKVLRKGRQRKEVGVLEDSSGLQNC